jgi:hypothetical protein
MAGQVVYHLLAQAGAARAPWPITTLVSCLPVLVLAMGTALAHMLRADAGAAADGPDQAGTATQCGGVVNPVAGLMTGARRCSRRTTSSLSAGVRPASTSSTPVSAPTASAASPRPAVARTIRATGSEA